MKRFVFVLLLCLGGVLFAATDVGGEPPVYAAPGTFSDDVYAGEQKLYIAVESLPEKVYVHEVFPVVLKITSLYKHIPYEIIAEGGGNCEVIRSAPLVAPRAINRVTFLFKATGSPVVLPAFRVVYETGEASARVSPVSLDTVRLNPPADFSGLPAKTLRVINYQASSFDERRNILVLELNASYADYRDFHLPGALREGIDSYRGDATNWHAVFFALFPAEKEKVTFSYFNIPKNRYEKFDIPILVKRSSVSTQTNLDPQASEFTKFKIAVTLFLIGMWLLLWWFDRKRWGYLVFVVAATAYLLTYLVPLKKVCIQKGATVYLLPTPQSTPFTTLSERSEAREMDRRGEYTKVQFSNNRIGWIRNEDLCAH